MQVHSIIRSGCFLFLGMMLFLGCSSETEMEQEFDREAMLSNYATNVINPAYQDLLTEVNELNSQAQAFTAAPEEASLANVRSAWETAFLAWQRANAFNFGPAGGAGLRRALIEEVGTWPVDTATVEAEIAAGDHSLAGFARDARGFLTVEYMLFGAATGGASVVEQYSQSNSRREHLNALTADLVSRIGQVANDWSSYQQDFIVNDGTDVGSSVSQLYNEWVRSFESVKNFKLGLPLGKRPGQTQAEPQLVEARYSGLSLRALREHLQTIASIYYAGGTPTDEEVNSLRRYLENVVGGPELIEQTEAQWAVVMNALDAVPADRSLQQLIKEGHPSVETLHTELQRHTRFFKSDMSSLLGIQITFSSGDGD